MLTKFEVSNFKNFAEKITFDLTDTNQYSFNSECVKNGIVNKGLIYGHNSTGKSNLGFAIFDLISHLTDKHTKSIHYSNYLNASNTSKAEELLTSELPSEDFSFAKFCYTFKIEDNDIEYSYGKKNNNTLIYEKLIINGKIFADVDRRINNVVFIEAAGAENLKRDIGESSISILSYIRRNAILDKDEVNSSFFGLIDFVDRMLFFRSLSSNNFIGLEDGNESVAEYIIRNGNLDDLELFLNKAGIDCKLAIFEDIDESKIAFKFGKKLIPFFDIASQGTRSLVLFYYWLYRLKEEGTVAFLFIDEFDAFYHHSLSALVVEELKAVGAQTIITTHNTSIMTNELLRPDCYFLLKSDGIKSLASSTVKELREGHNIEKMYRAGSFNG